MLTQERLKELLEYNPETGQFTWLMPRLGIRAGSFAGTLKSDGYIHISIDKKKYSAHRLAWFYSYGAWPASQLDHINGVACDNRISNLRDATPSQNMRNKSKRSDNTSGYKGVYYYKRGKCWRSQICLNGKTKCIGHFETPQKAYEAYCKAADEHYKEFARYG